ncbi:hypothetical protein UP06_19945 [Bradyrhizobium sp. LTSP857]|nr:hypothetical protein UP06_19945 [Bradyrhizobium sp. LTSP857]
MAWVNGDVIQEEVVCFVDEDQHPCYLTANFRHPGGAVADVRRIVVQHRSWRFSDPLDIDAICIRHDAFDCRQISEVRLTNYHGVS